MQQAEKMAVAPPRPKFGAVWRIVVAVIIIVFIAPALASAGWWASLDRPASWRQADWGASGVLSPAANVDGAVVHILSARTGGMKGAFATHSWIVTKKADANRYTRYDKVGWGRPVRVDAYPADALWYSNRPTIVGTVSGRKAERLIPKIEAAIAAYPYNQRDGAAGYRIYPGPNSNTFVAHVLRAVPEAGIVLPPTAVGRDYRAPGDFAAIAPDWRDLHFSLFGLAGFAAGKRSGLEVHFIGLVAGLDFHRIGVKIPGFGTLALY